MKPAICDLCLNDFRSEMFHAASGGDLVRFADYSPLDASCTGHPHGYEWFCAEHLASAQALASLNHADAMARLFRQYGPFPEYPPLAPSDPALWLVQVGANPARVFGIVRQAMALSPRQAKTLMANAPFKVMQAWPQVFRTWQQALEQAGASVEIRYPSSRSVLAESAAPPSR